MLLLISLVFAYFVSLRQKSTQQARLLALPAYVNKKRFPGRKPILLPKDISIYYF